jgi:class 3 adenylate cyclase
VDAHGLVTIMHFDVEGSTAPTTRAGDEAGRVVLQETKRVVREQVEVVGGREIEVLDSNQRPPACKAPSTA